jgi:hypothetical protein
LQVDPHAEEHKHINTYNNVNNNPINLTDPSGKCWRCINFHVSRVIVWAGSSKLNSAEQKVARQYPVETVDLYEAGTKGTAENFAANTFSDGKRDDGNGNAMKHALFNALNAQIVGQDIAKKFGDAHEDIPKSKGMSKLNSTLFDQRN